MVKRSGNPTVTTLDAAEAPQGGTGAADLSGRTLGEYHLLRRLGQGGMGQVYLAEQTSLKRRVALKILKADVTADPTALHRFHHEAEAVARATHVNIVQVYAIGSADGHHFMALEYVEGRNLRDFLARKGPPELRLALRIMIQVSAALQRAAEMGIIHRDIKPENILLTRQGDAKVADFGLSRVLTPGPEALSLTQTGVTMGTPLYMSPEQVEGKPIDPRTDIYSLGVTCYHMLSGQPPFRGQTAFEVALHHVRTEPQPLQGIRPDLPAELCTIVHRMMAKKPEDRYASCRELMIQLQQIRETVLPLEPSTGLPEGLEGFSEILPLSESQGSVSAVPTGPTLQVPRRPWGRLLGLMFVILGLAIGAAVGWLRLQPPDPPVTSATDNLDEAAPVPHLSESDKEKFLLTAVEQYWRPNPDQVALGTGHCVELALFYLDRWRLADADRFFKRLEAQGLKERIAPYRTLGRIGQGIVLALQDQPEKSNEQFLQLLNPNKEVKPDPERMIQVLTSLRSSRLRLWLARALDHNYENNPSGFPERLQALRKPPVVTNPPPRVPAKSGRPS